MYIIRNLLRYFLVKYSAYAKCEIIHSVNCEISHFVRCEMKFAHIRVSEYFTFAEQIFHSKAISLAHRANFVEKSTHCLGRQMCAFFCLKRDKRCLNKGNYEQKVSEITTSIPALSAVAIWEMYPLFRYNDTNCYKAFFHCDKFRLDLL